MWVAGTHIDMSFWTGTQSTNGLLWQIGNSMSRTLDDMKMTALTIYVYIVVNNTKKVHQSMLHSEVQADTV